MNALRFELKGETAFFKKPDVNIYAYFTYSHIHRIALFGMLGAILGLGGYMEQYNENYPIGKKRKGIERQRKFPEFYDVFKNATVSIVPHGDRGYFSKKIQIFNNTVGYASQEDGNVLNVREQWLENPHWTIYVGENEGIEKRVFEKLAGSLLQSRSVYIPYLGKNDHPATILKPKVVNLKQAVKPQYIDSLHRTNQMKYSEKGSIKSGQYKSFFREYMPMHLNETNNGYVLEQLVLTNHKIDVDSIDVKEQNNIYTDGDSTLYFM